MDRIVDIKPVEIFYDFFGVHWISLPTYDILMMFKTFLQLLKHHHTLCGSIFFMSIFITAVTIDTEFETFKSRYTCPSVSKQRKADAKRAKFDTII